MQQAQTFQASHAATNNSPLKEGQAGHRLDTGWTQTGSPM